ncbi:hypothetical protein GCK32_010308 [Trichostrongylus colubriformis]|uniref:Uncharacterized protein n=1 Tax=Trichostrongylus colubriformis TaxID=6319 RepID=A0AAN8IQT3_TRICO
MLSCDEIVWDSVNDFRFRSPQEFIARGNNRVSGDFVLNACNALSILSKLEKPYTVEKVALAVKQAFVDISPQDYDLALKQVAHSVICNQGILAFTQEHGLPQDNTHIVKEDISEPQNFLNRTPTSTDFRIYEERFSKEG